MLDRAYSMLEIKSLDEDQRILTGFASTPEVDRVGDIIDPFGASYEKEIPLLWQHKHESPVGIAELGRPTKKGIPFRAVIAKIMEDGPLKQLTEMAWQAVKARLVRGTSIGFNGEYDILPTGGKKYTKSAIYELSLVTVPCNARATIQTIKALGNPRTESGAVRLITRAAETPPDMNGAVRLVSARNLASLPLKAGR